MWILITTIRMAHIRVNLYPEEQTFSLAESPMEAHPPTPHGCVMLPQEHTPFLVTGRTACMACCQVNGAARFQKVLAR